MTSRWVWGGVPLIACGSMMAWAWMAGSKRNIGPAAPIKTNRGVWTVRRPSYRPNRWNEYQLAVMMSDAGIGVKVIAPIEKLKCGDTTFGVEKYPMDAVDAGRCMSRAQFTEIGEIASRKMQRMHDMG